MRIGCVHIHTQSNKHKYTDYGKTHTCPQKQAYSIHLSRILYTFYSDISTLSWSLSRTESSFFISLNVNSVSSLNKNNFSSWHDELKHDGPHLLVAGLQGTWIYSHICNHKHLDITRVHRVYTLNTLLSNCTDGLMLVCCVTQPISKRISRITHELTPAFHIQQAI